MEFFDANNNCSFALVAQAASQKCSTALRMAEVVFPEIDLVTGVAGDTRAKSRRNNDGYIVPAPSAIPVDTLACAGVIAWSNRVDAAGETRRNVHSLLSTALQDAARDELVPANVAKGIKIRSGEQAPREPVYLTQDEIASILDAIHGRGALANMGVIAQAGSATRVEDAVRTNSDLSEHDRRILLAVLLEMRMGRGGNGPSTAHINCSGESSIPDQEGSDCPTDDSSLAGVVAGTASSEQPPPDDSSLAEILPHDGHEQYLAVDIHGDELFRWRRERNATEQVGREGIPLPDDELIAGYDAPSEDRAMCKWQDADAEGLQTVPEDGN